MHTAVLGTALAAVLVLLVPASTSGAEGEQPEVNWSTLAYAEPAPTYRLRLGLEELFGVSAAFIGYVIENPPEAIPGLSRPYTVIEKLTFRPGSWTFDADDFGTNMVGHPTAGTVYYLIARGNRVSIPEAFAWTFGASLLWELVEFKEPVAINDQIMTSAGGLAIGEAMQQLSSWFDRGGDDAASQAMAFLFNPAKKIHDWLDGTVPDRDPRARGWHQFSIVGGAGFLHQSAAQATYPVFRFAGETRLFHAPGYGEPGRGTFTWGDGNASRIGLGVTFTGSQVVDYLFDTETALLGLYVREIDGPAEARHGHDLFLGGTSGYEYGLHRWNLSTGQPNTISLVRLPGLALRARWFSGPWMAAVGIDAALTFGGVQPFAFQPPPFYLPPGTALPKVLLANGYYFGVGFRGAPSIEVRWGEAAAGAALQVDLLTGVTEPDLVQAPGTMIHLDDQRWLATAWARWRFTGPGVELGLTAQWRSRSGSADDIRAIEQERSLLGMLGVAF